jgi:spoIIIJ-associated protein
MKKITVTGKTVEEAVKQGLLELGVTEDQVKIDIIEQPSKGLFGMFGSKDAKIEMEYIVDPIQEAIQFLQEVLQCMDLNVQIEKHAEDEIVHLNLTGKELGIIIGRRGQTLDALQYLVNIVANRHTKTHLRIILDAEQFRERRRKTLEDLADRLAGRVGKSRREIVLEPMSPHERKVIHSYLQDRSDVKTYSKGEEPNRRVVIAAK